jgi:transporter family protein
MWLLFSLLAMGAWGLCPLFEKAALRYFSPFTIMLLRQIMVASLLVAFFLFRLKALPPLSIKPALFVLASGLFGGLFGMWLYFMALRVGDASKVVPITGCYPLVASLLACLLFGEAFTLKKMMGILLIVVGIAMVR